MTIRRPVTAVAALLLAAAPGCDDGAAGGYRAANGSAPADAARDAAPVDAGPDAVSLDAAPADAWPADVASTDAARTDAAPIDGGNPDAAPVERSCDGLDDDGDGLADEGFACVLGESGECETACGTTGRRTCVEGCEWTACVPPLEVCNGRDDDCDGEVDQGFACSPGAESACRRGCGPEGVRVCGDDCTWGACDAPEVACDPACAASPDRCRPDDDGRCRWDRDGDGLIEPEAVRLSYANAVGTTFGGGPDIADPLMFENGNRVLMAWMGARQIVVMEFDGEGRRTGRSVAVEGWGSYGVHMQGIGDRVVVWTWREQNDGEDPSRMTVSVLDLDLQPLADPFVIATNHDGWQAYPCSGGVCMDDGRGALVRLNLAQHTLETTYDGRRPYVHRSGWVEDPDGGGIVGFGRSCSNDERCRYFAFRADWAGSEAYEPFRVVGGRDYTPVFAVYHEGRYYVTTGLAIEEGPNGRQYRMRVDVLDRDFQVVETLAFPEELGELTDGAGVGFVGLLDGGLAVGWESRECVPGRAEECRHVYIVAQLVGGRARELVRYRLSDNDTAPELALEGPDPSGDKSFATYDVTSIFMATYRSLRCVLPGEVHGDVP